MQWIYKPDPCRMACSSNKTKNWNIYSKHYSPAISPTTSQSTNSDNGDLATAKRPSSDLPLGRQRSVFPYGIVREYDLKDVRTSDETSAYKIYPGKLGSISQKWSSSPCLSKSSSTARWGTKILQTSACRPSCDDGESIELTKSRRRHFRRRMHSCPTTPVNGSIRIEIPKLSSIRVQAQSVSLVSRPLQPVMPTKLKTTSPSTASTVARRPRAASVNSVEREKKTTESAESQDKEKKLSKSSSEIKIEDGVIFIENGKAIDLRKEKLGRKHKLKSTEASKSKSYCEFQDVLQKFEDAQLNLEGEVNTKAKTFETKDKEQKFFEERVQTQFMDLLSSVKEKRKKKRGKKYQS